MGACGFADSHLTQPAEFVRQHLNLILNGLRAGPRGAPVL
jgi:hypothetical protein